MSRSRTRRMFNAKSVFDGRLVDQHDGDVVFDWVDSPALVALEPFSVLDDPNRGLALGTHQNLDKRWVNSHLVTIGQLKTATPDRPQGCRAPVEYETIRLAAVTPALLAATLIVAQATDRKSTRLNSSHLG